MTSRERLLAVLGGNLPDCVPVAPDFSNMIPARRTGKPFWDLYLYNDPPIWEAYLDCAKHFDIDALMDGYFPLILPDGASSQEAEWETAIIERTAERIVTRRHRRRAVGQEWADAVTVYPVADSPSYGLPLAKLELPVIPASWEPLTGVKPVDRSPAGFRRVQAMMGDQGLVGAWLASTVAFYDEEGVYRYYDHPELHETWAAERVATVERRWAWYQEQGLRPDFFCVGGSGTLVCQTVEMFRKVALPAVKLAIELATAAGIPTHVHSCGPERELVQIMAEETHLTVIDPLEIPPMGNCNLADLKRHYGKKLTLKGNLHTTDVMLRGTPEDVARAARQAIDDAAAGGRFILATGDQCGRDTPDANLHAMVETARTYGKY